MTDILRYADIAAEAYDAKPAFIGRGVWGEDIRAISRIVDGDRAVAVRGTTKDPRDVLHDIDAWPVRHPHIGWSHPGIVDAAKSLITPMLVSDIVPSVPEWASGLSSNIVLVGHSLGGGVALAIGALLVAKYRVVPKAIIAFEPPRVGMRQFKKVLSAVPEILIYRNRDDVIPLLPWFVTWTADWYRQPAPVIQLGSPALSSNPITAHSMAAVKAALSSIKR